MVDVSGCLGAALHGTHSGCDDEGVVQAQALSEIEFGCKPCNNEEDHSNTEEPGSHVHGRSNIVGGSEGLVRRHRKESKREAHQSTKMSTW